MKIRKSPTVNQIQNFSPAVRVRQPLDLVVLFCGAFFVRMMFVLQNSLGRAEIVADAVTYHEYAINLFTKGTFIATAGRAWRTPGYPFFLGLICAVSHDSVFAVQLVQCVISALTCVLLFKCSLLFLESRRWSLVTAWIAVFYFDLYAGTPHLLSEVLYAFLITWFFYIVWTRQESLKDSFLIGIFVGLCGLIRPEFLLFGFVFCLFLWRGTASKSTSRILIYGLGVVITYGPWILRNYLTFHRFFPTALHSTMNTYIGLYHPLDALGFVPPIQDYMVIPMTEVGYYDYYHQQVALLYHQMPWHTILWAYLDNFVVFFYPFLPNYDMTFVILLPFWLLGGCLAVLYRNRQALLVLTYVVVTVSIYTVVNGTAGPRFRQPLSPAYILLAGFALNFLFENWKRKSLPVILGAWLLFNGGVKLAQSQIRLIYKKTGTAFIKNRIASSNNPLGG